jgi:hypothetical protein
MSKRPVTIDFSGGACTGKTFVKNEILRRFHTNYRCMDLSEKKLGVFDYIGFPFRAPASFLASLAYIIIGIPRGYIATFKITKKWLTMQIKINNASRSDTDMAFLDEGFFKWMSNIREYSLRKITFGEIPACIRRNLIYPDISVFVAADFDTVQRRKIIRGLTPEKKGDKMVDRFQRYQNSRLLDILAAEREGFIKAIYYDNSGNFNISLSEEIISFLH